MSNYKLTYFDFNGGRAEPIRIAMHSAGIQFEDIRWSFAEFGEKRQGLPFNAVPVLEMNGHIVTQSMAICRYIGRQADLYPTDALQALYCDEVLGALEDLNHFVVQTFGLEGDALKLAREKLVDGRLTVYIKGLAQLLTRGGGKYFADQKLTIADLYMYVQIKSLQSGNLDHIPIDIVDQLAPNLAEHFVRITSEPIVADYYASIK